MNSTNAFDVLVVGAGTAGTYLSWRLARQGYRCIVLEKDSLESLGTHIGPFHMEKVAFERFDLPLPSGDELMHAFSDMTMWAPGHRESFGFQFPTLCMDKPLFIQRLHSYAREAGVEIREGAEVSGLIFGGGMLRGVTVTDGSGTADLEARLVIDASGVDGAVRTRMPAGGWMENDPLEPRDTMFVYMETWSEVEGIPSGAVVSYPYQQGWCAPGPGDTRIVGIGMTGSLEAAKQRHRAFVEGLPYTGKVENSTWGTVPYRRPPFSLVDNNLMVVGDAAFMNKPFSGEGVISGFTACDIVVEVASHALESDDLTVRSLWEYNNRYFRDQGAKFAFLMAALPGLMSLSEGEMEFFFTVPGLLTPEGSEALQNDYEIKADPAAGLGAVPHILKGIMSGAVSLKSLLVVAKAAIAAAGLKSLYRKYPAHPMDFGPWVRPATRLWKVAERTRTRYFEGIL